MKHLTCRRIIIDYMIATAVRTELILQRCIGMGNGYIPESGVSAQAGCLEQQLKVHHIVDDDGACPAAFRLPSLVSIP